jgi:hypothetical protein
LEEAGGDTLLPFAKTTWNLMTVWFMRIKGIVPLLHTMQAYDMRRGITPFKIRNTVGYNEMWGHAVA